jgi:hypothetical protein
LDSVALEVGFFQQDAVRVLQRKKTVVWSVMLTHVWRQLK